MRKIKQKYKTSYVKEIRKYGTELCSSFQYGEIKFYFKDQGAL